MARRKRTRKVKFGGAFGNSIFKLGGGFAGSTVMNFLEGNVAFFAETPVLAPAAVYAAGLFGQIFGKSDLVKNVSNGMEVIGGVELLENGIDMAQGMFAGGNDQMGKTRNDFESTANFVR